MQQNGAIGCRNDGLESAQQSILYQAYMRLSVAFERAPSLSELRSACQGQNLENVSKDRYRHIINEVNDLLPDNARIKLTEDRPCFVYYHRVRDLFAEHLRTKFEAPSFKEFLKELEARNISIGETSVKNIIELARNDVPESERHLWRFSHKRIAVTWDQIIAAHGDALELLKKQGVSRNPAAQEIAFFLEQRGHPLKADALGVRLKHKPEAVTIKVSPYSDTTITAIKTCHKSLREQLKRAPTIAEITSAVNEISIKQFTEEAILERCSKYNNQHSRGKIILTAKRQSGVYDSDLKASHAALKEELGRAPTFQEIFAVINPDPSQARLSADALLRRLSKLRLSLTHPFKFKQEQQEQMKSAYLELRKSLKRLPLGDELLLRCNEMGMSINREDSQRIFGTLRRRMSGQQREELRLGSPYAFSGHLIEAYTTLRESLQRNPSIKDLAKKLEWSDAGVSNLLLYADQHLARRGRAPLLVRGTEQEANLTRLADFIRNIRNPLSSGDLRNLSPEVKQITREWLSPACTRMSFFLARPELLPTRLHILWLSAVYHFTSPHRVSSESLQRSQIREGLWGERHGFSSPDANPFTGVAHALVGAAAMRRISVEQVKGIFNDLSQSHRADGSIRRTALLIRTLAECSGFPSDVYMRLKTAS